MESCRILYRIKVAHDYFAEAPCPALQCRLTPQGEALARRRGLLLRQTAADEWTLLSYADPAENDALTLDLCMTDAHFPLYTEWSGFRPSEAYVLELPQTEETVEAATAFLLSGRKRAIGSGFCTVVLRLTQGMAEAARGGSPMQATICFRAPSVRWEYLFIPRDGESLPSGGMCLEDTAGTVEFSDFKKCEVYGKQAWRTVSEAPVPMHRNYGCRLRLVVQETGRPKRILLLHVPPPVPGRFPDAERGTIRQVCYY